MFAVAVGVGSNDPDAISLVRGAGVDRSQHAPSRVIPQRGKITEDSGKSSVNKSWAVFHEDVTRSNFADNARHVSPHAAFGAVDAPPFACDGDVLAREASRNHVNNSSPGMPVEGLNVIPDRERRENAVILSGEQYACGIGVPLDGADGAPAEKVASEYAATSACE